MNSQMSQSISNDNSHKSSQTLTGLCQEMTTNIEKGNIAEAYRILSQANQLISEMHNMQENRSSQSN